MDLFGDLPEPGTASKKDEAHVPGAKRPSTESHEEPPPKKSNSGLFQLRAFCADRQGERDDMQDAHTIVEDFRPHVPGLPPSVEQLSFYAVFDGHGGVKASQYAAANIHKQLASIFPKGDFEKIESEIKRKFIESYKKTDEEFLKAAAKSKPAWKDGTTATCILAINNTLYIANLGDSKAVLCRHNATTGRFSAVSLSRDHTPTQYEERMRIQKAGGSVREGRVMGVLEVSRSIGDGPYKKLGVSCVPEVKRCQLTADDRFILIACDGLWKSFSTDEAIQEVLRITQGAMQADRAWEAAAAHLASQAVRKLSADNVTVLLVRVRSDD